MIDTNLRNALHRTTEVQTGHRIEILVPELPEGQQVDVILVPRSPESPPLPSLLEFLDRLPPGPRSARSWDDLERQFQEQRDAWDH
ncbi:MAG: hypothetical protein ACLP7Q_02575 [Isosphaeraceae bacterium]